MKDRQKLSRQTIITLLLTMHVLVLLMLGVILLMVTSINEAEFEAGKSVAVMSAILATSLTYLFATYSAYLFYSMYPRFLAEVEDDSSPNAKPHAKEEELRRQNHQEFPPL